LAYPEKPECIKIYSSQIEDQAGKLGGLEAWKPGSLKVGIIFNLQAFWPPSFPASWIVFQTSLEEK
jgi:hypothetical protein